MKKTFITPQVEICMIELVDILTVSTAAVGNFNVDGNCENLIIDVDSLFQ